jgi:hypothetical protein
MDNLEDNLMDNLEDNLMDNLWNNLGNNLRGNLRGNLTDNLWDNLGNNFVDFKYTSTSIFGNLSDYGWTCLYDFINNEIFPYYNFDPWTNWKKLIESNIYDMIQLDGLCIVMSMPCKISTDDLKRIHNESESSVSWRDGYEVYSWHGIIVQKEWIVKKEMITKQIIIKETNAEKRRCLQEILGSKKFAEILGCEVVDEDMDLQGNKMKLWRTKEKDSICNEFIQFYNCICPSTGREYWICVPETCKNTWGAKAWTLGNEKAEIRHGDVFLTNLSKEYTHPIHES